MACGATHVKLRHRGPGLALGALTPTGPGATIVPPYGPLAQLVEHRTFNPRVAGSSPARLILYGPVLRGFLVLLSRDRGARGPEPARKFTECTRRSWSRLV